jgi:1-deoxy-D-xylulose-5-phosphate reductoisomerase
LATVIHPQSIVHCLVSYTDGSVIAQMSFPDMRTPIALALSWPQRMNAPTPRLDLAAVGTLSFEAPDPVRFPSLTIAREALVRGGTAPAILSAANEIAVEAFLARQIGFLDIARNVADTLEAAEGRGLLAAPDCLGDILAADAEGRRLAQSLLGRYV